MIDRLWGENQGRFAWIAFAALFVNALIFVLLVSDPLLTQDAWYFLDVFVRHAYDGTLGVDDFFVQRAGLDHAQPLRKLILLMELKWFRLSMLPEAVVGLFCAAFCAYLLYRLIRRQADAPGLRTDVALMWLAMGGVLISLNSTGIWTWPLVALSYTSLVFVLWFFIAIWRALDERRYSGLVASTMLLALVADDTSVLAGAAAVVAVLALGWRRCLSDGWWRVPLVFVAIIAMAQVLIGWLGPVVGTEGLSQPGIGSLIQAFLNGGWWRWPVLALSNSVVSLDTLRWIDATHAVQWQVLLAVVVGALHVWFWWCFLHSKPTGTVFVAACLMLLFYASVAGIVYGRVGVFGSDYLNQPRYVLFYQLNLVALALMYVGTREAVAVVPHRRSLGRGVGTACVVVLLALQLVFAKHAWHAAPFIRLYYWKMAEQTRAMGQHPETTPQGCAPELPICTMPPQQRADLLALLQEHRLNLFNDKFRAMHGFRP